MPKPVLLRSKIYLGFKWENIIDLRSWKKCDHCKGQYELYLNYNSENNFPLWADMMEKDLE